MLSRLLPASRRLAGTRIVAARPTVQAASFHAGTCERSASSEDFCERGAHFCVGTGPVLRDEEKAAEPAEEKGSFLLESLGDWHRAVPIGVAMAIPAVQLDVRIYSLTRDPCADLCPINRCT